MMERMAHHQKKKSLNVENFYHAQRWKDTDNDYHYFNVDGHCFGEHYQVSSRDMKKRKQLSLHDFEGYAGAGRKVDTAMGVWKRRRLIARHLAQIPEKVDAVSSPQILFGEKDMHDSLKNSASHFLIWAWNREIQTMKLSILM